MLPIEKIPKAEIHCHIEGAAQPLLVTQQARKYGVDVSEIIRDGRYIWHDFTTFLKAYDVSAGLFRTAEDYALLAEDCLRIMHVQGALYGEFFVSPVPAFSSGLTREAYMEGMEEGAQKAEEKYGIIARFTMTGIRHLGPDMVLEAAKYAAQCNSPRLTGFGMGGDERMYHPKDFASAFHIARDAGLGITNHAGEFGGPESIIATLDHLGATRIGHGVRAIEDAKLIERLARDKIVLEVCPASNIALGVYANFASHPLRRLDEAGVIVTISSDDPPFFATSLADEYQIARDHFGYDDAGLLRLTENALKAAFVDEGTRKQLITQFIAASR